MALRDDGCLSVDHFAAEEGPADVYNHDAL